MSQRLKPRVQPDSFLETLHSQIVRGTESLTAWLSYLDEHDGVEDLFELETWLRGLRAFFDVQHVPMAPTDRSNPVKRSFAAEFRVARDAIQICERLASRVMSRGQPDRVEFETFIESQLRKETVLDYHVGRILEQPTPAESLGRLQEFLNDAYVLIDRLSGSNNADLQAFVSLARFYRHELTNCRYVDMLLSQRFRVQFDKVEQPLLSGLLRRIPDRRLRQNMALAFLYMYRLLRYLDFVEGDFSKDKPLRQTLVVFALLHQECDALSDFLKSRSLKGRDTGSDLSQAAELVMYSLKLDSQRVIERELVPVAWEEDPTTILSRLQDAHGVLRNSLQSAVITLAQAFDKNLDGRSLFPSLIEGAEESQRLLKNLWELRRSLKSALAQGEHVELERVVMKLNEFRESALRTLWYKDWAVFERYSDALMAAPGPGEVQVTLRKLVSYLEKLVQDVSKRRILQTGPAIDSPGQ